jgi:phytol kinase
LDNPLGIIGIMNLIAGDGMAAVGGTFLPLARLPWNKAKSIGGLLSYWISAWVTSAVFLWWFQTLGYFPKLTGAWIIAVVLAGFFGGVVESFPLGALDNFCVPAVSMFVANYLSCKSL